MPTLTPNAQHILNRAWDLHHEVGTEGVDPSCVFGALLDTRGATAAVVLANLIARASLRQLRDSYFDWLTANGLSWAQTLERDFPRPTHGEPGSTSAAGDSPQSPVPWPFVFALRGGDEPGLGLLIEPGLIAVPGDSAPQSAVDGSGRKHRLTMRHTGWRVALMEMSPPADAVPPPARPRKPGDHCMVAVTDGRGSNITLVDGQIGAQVGADEFLVELDAPLSGAELAVGSPVIVDGSVVGIAGAAVTQQTIGAFETS